jgi:hypothetical protein
MMMHEPLARYATSMTITRLILLAMAVFVVLTVIRVLRGTRRR